MKKFLLLMLAVSLAGCQTAANLVSAAAPVVASGDAVVLDGTKALAVAADAYAGIADSLTIAVKAGQFSTTQLTMIKTLNNTALSLLQGSDKTLTVAQRAAGVMLIVTQLHSILGK